MDLRRSRSIGSSGRRMPVFGLLAVAGAFLFGALGGYLIGERDLVVVVEESPSLLDTGELDDPEPAEVAEEAVAAPGVDDGDPSPGDAEEDVITDTDPSTIYVSPDGSDDADGQTPASPFRSLERAVAEVQPGMTLFVMEGVHVVEGQGPTLIPLVREGAPDRWTRILGFGDSRPVIIARGGALFEALGSYIEIGGLELRGEGFSAENSYGYGVLLGDGHHFRVVDNVVSGFPVSGIGAVRTSHIYIADNVVFDNSYWGTEQGSGLSVFHSTNYGFADDEFGYSDYFINNVVFGNENRVTSRFVEGEITDGNGIIIDNGDETGYLGRTLIANNVIHGNGGRGIWAYASSRVDIFNNTLFGNVRTGEALNGARAEIASADGSDVRVINNVAWNLSEMNTYFFAGSGSIEISTNVGVGGPVVGHDGEGIEIVEPGEAVFLAPDPDDPAFAPAPGSVLIDGGSPISLPIETDAAGGPRVVGSAVDIGAYEFVPS